MSQPSVGKGASVGIAATSEALVTLANVLNDHPVLWVGAGASMAAGYPSTSVLEDATVRRADDPIDRAGTFFQRADAFVASMGEGAFEDLLQEVLGRPRPPAVLHRHLARLAKAGVFHTIVTTNYDDLLERALADAGVTVVLRVLERNETVRETSQDGFMREPTLQWTVVDSPTQQIAIVIRGDATLIASAASSGEPATRGTAKVPADPAEIFTDAPIRTGLMAAAFVRRLIGREPEG